MRALAEIVHLRTGECREASQAITQIAADEAEDVDAHSAAHIGECLRCQAEVAAYRRIVRTMHAMRHDAVTAPAGSIAAVIAALEAAAIDQHSTWAVKAAYVGGITVATAAAGAAGVLVWMSRRRLAEAS
jgi:hypothetical protein